MFKFFRRTSAEEKETQRLSMLYRDGRGVEGVLTDYSEGAYFFTYEVRSVVYHASQDIGQLSDLVPPDPEHAVGPVVVRYSPKNPANSMVLCREWSGLRGETKLLMKNISKTMLALVMAAVLLTGQAAFAAGKPKTVIHVINVKFKDDAKKEDITKAIDAIYSVAGKYKGIKNVWLNPITVQGGASKFTHCLVMEFESVDALKKYTDSPEQKEFYKFWLPVRELSNTHDVTN